MAEPRVIFHVDMDGFFAAIEQLDHPELRGKPILVGSDRARGVVCTASYEARKFGCHSAQPMAVARRRCPNAIIVPVRGARYREVSEQVFEILHDFSPLVEPLSIDEAFLDMTGTARLLGPPADAAGELKRRIHERLRLTASVGIAPNKYLAKLASDRDKPDGLTIVPPDDVAGWLDPLPISNVWGIGPRTADRLRDLGVSIIADLRALPFQRLESIFGSMAEHFHNLANGRDDRAVVPNREAKSIGQEQTFEIDVDDREQLGQLISSQCEQVTRRMRRHALVGRTVTLKLRYGDFETITRSVTLDEPTDRMQDVRAAVVGLFGKWADERFRPVRLIGVAVKGLASARGQMSLFEDPRKQQQERVDRTMDQIVERFGPESIQRWPGARTGRGRPW